jgi:hypothetical protein
MKVSKFLTDEVERFGENFHEIDCPPTKNRSMAGAYCGFNLTNDNSR